MNDLIWGFFALCLVSAVVINSCKNDEAWKNIFHALREDEMDKYDEVANLLFMKMKGKNGYERSLLEREIATILRDNFALSEMTTAQAEDLSQRTDYAHEAIEYPETKINWADAGAFFLEGYEYARKLMNS